jgi:hypothetical protein
LALLRARARVSLTPVHQYLKLNLSSQIEYGFCLELPSC